MNIPDNLKYTKDHEWIRVDGETATVGITEYAQGELGDVVFVDIDTNLTEINKGDSFGTIEAVKTVSDMYAPCSGKILEINKDLTDNPEFVNNDPYGKGWMVKVELKDAAELNDLLDNAAYGELTGQ